METINKKQVKTMLKVLNEQKKLRPAISNIKVNIDDENIKLIFTDSYMLVEMSIKRDNQDTITYQDDLFISYDDLNTWYKLATAKWNLVDDLDTLIKSSKSWHDYPDIESAKKRFIECDQKTHVKVNSKLLNTCCELFNGEAINIKVLDMAMLLNNNINGVNIDILLLGMK